MPHSTITLRRRPGYSTSGRLVTLNSVGSKTYVGLTSTSFNYTGLTISAGPQIALCVGIVFGYSNSSNFPTGISVSWDGVALTNIQNVGAIYGPTFTKFSIVTLWGLVAPAIGNKTLAVSWTNAAEAFCAGIAFNGVDQSSFAAAFSYSQNASSSILTHDAGVYLVSSPSTKMVAASAPMDVNTINGLTGTVIFADATSGLIMAAMNYDVGNAPLLFNGSSIGSVGAAVGFQPIAVCNIQAG